MKLLKKPKLEFSEDGPTTGELEHLTKMIRNQSSLEASLEEKFEEAYKIIEELNDLRLKKLPEYAGSIGVDSLTLSSGETFEIKSEISAKIPKNSELVAINWLKSNGHGSIVKREISIKFDTSKESEERFQYVTGHILKGHGIEYDVKSTVHPATLKKFATERLEEMDDTFDRKLFGVYDVQQSIINGRKPPKFKKS